MKCVVTWLFLGMLCLAGVAQAQTDTYLASGTWTAPVGVTSVTVEVWGGGGAGGGNSTNRDGGGGGGGGAYSKSVAIPVIPGNVYTVTVGAGGTGVVGGTGGAGGDSWFATAGTILAKGGTGGAPPVSGNGGLGGAGGAAPAGVGTTRFSGGDGGAGRDRNNGEGGPGGSSAGTAANGTSGSDPWSTSTAGAAPVGGGIGGDGASNADGNPPASGNGGGGGGSGDTSGPGGDRVGGNGAGGIVAITYSPAPVLIAEYRMDAASWNSTANEVVDSSGNGNNAQSFNSANTDDITPAIAGNPGTCRYGVFDNGSTITSGYIQTPLPDLITDFTVTAWIRTTNNAPGGQRILIDDQNNAGGYGISLGDGGAGRIRFYSRGIGPIILDSTYTIANNTWYFVAAVADISNRIRTIYVFNSAGTLLNSTSDASAFTGTWGTDAGPVSIGGETNASGEAPANFHFHGNLDEVRVYQNVVSQSALEAIATQTHPCTTTDHFDINHDTTAINCQAEPVTIEAHLVDHTVDTAYTGTLNLTTSTGKGDWTVITGAGALNNGAANDGVASYTMVAGDLGVVELGLKDTTVESVNINLSDGSFTELTGTALASEDQNLDFANSGFVFLADSVASGLGPQIGGKASSLAPGNQLLELQAIRTSDTTGACEAALQGVTPIELAFKCRNPASCTANQVNINGGTATNIAGNALGPIGSYTPVNLDFGDATDTTASFVMNYPDVGELQLYARYNIPLDDGSSTPSGVYISGNSNAFVVRPFGFNVVAAGNPAATGPAGAQYTTAGSDFSVSATAVLYQAADDSNNDGIPDNHNDTDPSNNANLGNNTAALNYGQEIVTESLVLSALLNQPSGGNDPGLLGSTTISAFVNGVGSTAAVHYDEVGIIELSANVADGNYLGVGLPATASLLGKSGYVGRFYPGHFAIANPVITNRVALACAPASSFTYMGENYQITYDLEVWSTDPTGAPVPVLTQNYVGAFAKLDLTAIGGPTGMNYGATDSVSNLTARLGVASTGVFAAGVAPVQATLSLNRDTPDIPDGAYSSFEVGIAPVDSDSVTLAALDLTLNGVLPNSHGLLGQTEIRYGRLNTQNNFGSELLGLTLPMATEYYLDATAEFITNADDSCTAITPADVLLYNDQDPKTGRVLGDNIINVNGASTTTLTAVAPITNGLSTMSFSAPGAEGYVDVEVQTPTYLRSDLDGIDQGIQGPGLHCTPGLGGADPAFIAGCAADANDVDDIPLSRGTFGIFKGSDNVIYTREVY